MLEEETKLSAAGKGAADAFFAFMLIVWFDIDCPSQWKVDIIITTSYKLAMKH